MSNGRTATRPNAGKASPIAEARTHYAAGRIAEAERLCLAIAGRETSSEALQIGCRAPSRPRRTTRRATPISAPPCTPPAGSSPPRRRSPRRSPWRRTCPRRISISAICCAMPAGSTARPSPTPARSSCGPTISRRSTTSRSRCGRTVAPTRRLPMPNSPSRWRRAPAGRCCSSAKPCAMPAGSATPCAPSARPVRAAPTRWPSPATCRAFC